MLKRLKNYKLQLFQLFLSLYLSLSLPDELQFAMHCTADSVRVEGSFRIIQSAFLPALVAGLLIDAQKYLIIVRAKLIKWLVLCVVATASV